MSLFRKPESTSAFLKMGIMGFAGAGKTYTATQTAAGIVKMARKLELPYAGKPVLFLDTETGSDFVVPDMEQAGIEVLVAKTRAFADLKTAMREATDGASVLIIDSITHFWMEWLESYAKAKKRNRLQFQDWGAIKREWRNHFTDPFINAPVHIIMCGRAGYEYDHFEDDDGKKQLEKSGIKMKAEGELGFEPSLLVYMDRHVDPDTSRAIRRAHILKDRSRKIDGKVFENPKFSDFKPHIDALNLGGEQMGVDTSRNSEDMVEKDKFDDRKRALKIVREEIWGLLGSKFGTAKADKEAKREILIAAFGTDSETEVNEKISLEELQSGYDKIHLQLVGKPSRYDTGLTEAFDDEIPDFPGDTPMEKPRVRVKAPTKEVEVAP